MACIESVSIDTDFEIIKTIIERDGCIVLKNALTPDALKGLNKELSAHLDTAAHCSGDFYGYVTKRLSGLIEKCPATRMMAVQPTLLAVMDEFMLRGCSEYQLNLTQAIRIGPGEPAQIVHRDDAMFPLGAKTFEAMINCMWAVDDFTDTNGATLLVPGSHKWPDDRQPEPHEIVKGTMKAGSVLIYIGSLLHAGGANVSDKYRTGLVISYCVGWLRQAENQYLATPLDLARTLPERLQRLLGYFVHKPNLGCVEGQDPLILLKEGSLANKPFTEFLPDEVVPLLREYRAKAAKAA